MSYNTNLGNELHPDMQQAGVPHNANNTTAGNTMNSNNNNNHGSMGFTSTVVHQPMHGSVTSVNTIGSIPNAAPSGLIQPGQSMPLNQHHQLHQAHGAGNPINNSFYNQSTPVEQSPFNPALFPNQLQMDGFISKAGMHYSPMQQQPQMLNYSQSQQQYAQNFPSYNTMGSQVAIMGQPNSAMMMPPSHPQMGFMTQPGSYIGSDYQRFQHQTQIASNTGGEFNQIAHQHHHHQQQQLPNVPRNQFEQNFSNMFNNNWINGNGDRIRTVHHQLMLIIHTISCERIEKERQSKGLNYSCLHNYCSKMRKTLDHCRNCNLPHCSIQHCNSTREMMDHWDSCKNVKCIICGPLRIQYLTKQETAYN